MSFLRWARTYGRSTFTANDFKLGVAAAVGVATYVVLRGGGPTPIDRSTVLLSLAALGVAELAVALTALAILVGVMNDVFIAALDHADETGIASAMAPYQTVSVLGAMTTAISLGVTLIPPETANVWKALPFGLAAGFAVWTTWGTVQLVNLTAFFGLQRGKLLLSIIDARRRLDQLPGTTVAGSPKPTERNPDETLGDSGAPASSA